MVTRLQSAKGSFVQSPKGAFDGEEVIIVPEYFGIMTNQNDRTTQTMTVLSVCNITFVAGAGSHQFVVTLNTPGGPSVSEATTLAYLGDFGDTWSAELLQVCVTPPSGGEVIYIYADDTGVPIGANIAYANTMLVFADEITGEVREVWIYVNYGQFPGTPVPNWVNGEGISLIPPP